MEGGYGYGRRGGMEEGRDGWGKGDGETIVLHSHREKGCWCPYGRCSSAAAAGSARLW